MRGTMLRLLATALAVALLLLPTFASAAESVTLVAVAGTGCDNDQFHVTVQRAGLDGGDPYVVHFVASASGHIYTNQAVSVTADGSSDYYIYTNFSAGPVQDQGVFPIANNVPVQIDVALERPSGKVLTSRRMIVDGCNTGVVQSNGALPNLSHRPETLQAIDVNGTGCDNDQFNLDVVGSNLDNGPYTMRSVAAVAGLVYMNTLQSWVSDDERLEYVYGSFSYGSVPNLGTFPMPNNQPVQIDLTLERPAGVVIYAWRVVVNNCVDGAVTFSGPAAVVGPVVSAVPVPATDRLALIVIAVLIALLGVCRRRNPIARAERN